MAWRSTNYAPGGFAATIFVTFVATNPKILPGLGWRRGDSPTGAPPQCSGHLTYWYHDLRT